MSLRILLMRRKLKWVQFSTFYYFNKRLNCKYAFKVFTKDISVVGWAYRRVTYFKFNLFISEFENKSDDCVMRLCLN